MALMIVGEERRADQRGGRDKDRWDEGGIVKNRRRIDSGRERGRTSCIPGGGKNENLGMIQEVKALVEQRRPWWVLMSIEFH